MKAIAELTGGARIGLCLLAVSAWTFYKHEPLSNLKIAIITFSCLFLGAIMMYKYETDSHFALRYSPSRHFSRFKGTIAEIYIPIVLRRPIFKLWAWFNKVNLNELKEALEHYNSLQSFFTRDIKPRPISDEPNAIVSPNDGTITFQGEIQTNEQVDVKDIIYRVGELFTGLKEFELNDQTIQELKHHRENKLFLLKTFLAPGNYHHYRAPVDFTIKGRNHIAGFVRTLNPHRSLTITNLFEENERIVLTGAWEQGFMAVVFIAAGWQVAGMTINFDPDIKTDMPMKETSHIWKLKTYPDGKVEEGNKETVVNLLKTEAKGIKLSRGEEIGMFKFGSAIALLFEAKPDWGWRKQINDVILYGEVVGSSKQN